PTDTHHSVTMQALESGVHALVEKPITSTVEQAWDLVRLAEAKGLVLQVGHIERFRLAGLLRGVQLNRPRFIETHRLSPKPGREQNIDVISDLMIHDLDLALDLMGCDPIQVSAIGMPVITDRFDIANAR